ncbi:hypothetical protein [Amycolatopsis taiwanensis]|uniref:Potassium-transporting ATPase n=1 Tax=Amycolatopsis taiwanensis TaxID=342230 RepID=A0A9W6R200_9PSEU|nr:hypothetical protein [Amycolatopsis taiwanensis]GLY67833.1 hypothetical protein Atai01_44520 [Amycolatopsis taiwanensis]
MRPRSGDSSLHARPARQPRGGRTEEDGGEHMADVLYVLLLIGIFAVLGLVLRGLERL